MTGVLVIKKGKWMKIHCNNNQQGQGSPNLSVFTYSQNRIW